MLLAGTFTYSAAAPGRPTPIGDRFGHRFGLLARHQRQFPQTTFGSAAIKSPSLKLFTLLPTSTT